MAIRIYCKHSPMFINPDPTVLASQKEKFIRTKPGFNDVPEWVRQDKTFQSGITAGIIMEIASQPVVSVPGAPAAPKLTKAQQKELAKEIGHDIELIDACTSTADLDSIKGSLKHPEHADVVEAITEKTAALTAAGNEGK